MKQWIIAVLVVLQIGLLAACTQYRTFTEESFDGEHIEWRETTGTSSFAPSFGTYNGKDVRSFPVKKGETVTVQYESKVEAGTLTLRVLDAEGGELAVLPVNEKGIKKLKAEADGKWKIESTGDRAKGSFKIRVG